jgi:hypothetical protein
MGSMALPNSAGWAIERGLQPIEEQLRRRRWRILEVVLPHGHGLGAQPPWVQSPDQFVYWIAASLSAQAIKDYLGDLEAVAKQTCDLELLRLARRYQNGRKAR